MTFDPISHAAGIGAGQEAASRLRGAAQDAEHNAAMSDIKAKGAQNNVMALAVALKKERDENAALQNEIHNKWIPYGVRLRASIMARQVEKEDLIDALKAGDPSNAERIAQEALQHRKGDYDRIVNDPKAVGEVREVVLKEAEAGRLG